MDIVYAERRTFSGVGVNRATGGHCVVKTWEEHTDRTYRLPRKEENANSPGDDGYDIQDKKDICLKEM